MKSIEQIVDALVANLEILAHGRTLVSVAEAKENIRVLLLDFAKETQRAAIEPSGF